MEERYWSKHSPISFLVLSDFVRVLHSHHTHTPQNRVFLPVKPLRTWCRVLNPPAFLWHTNYHLLQGPYFLMGEMLPASTPLNLGALTGSLRGPGLHASFNKSQEPQGLHCNILGSTASTSTRILEGKPDNSELKVLYIIPTGVHLPCHYIQPCLNSLAVASPSHGFEKSKDKKRPQTCFTWGELFVNKLHTAVSTDNTSTKRLQWVGMHKQIPSPSLPCRRIIVC